LFLPLSRTRQGSVNMGDFLDILWFKIIDVVHCIQNLLDVIFAPLNFFGPAVAILTISFLTVIITKILTNTFKTKRYQELENEFKYWFNLRQEALKCEDPEKAKLLAKNIDEAKLNTVYWNYFVEGFLHSIATKYLPVLIFLAYVNEAYQPSRLLKLFGREYVFKFGNFNNEEVLVGSVLWYIISILLSYLAWYVVGKIYSKHFAEKKTELSGERCSA